MQNPFHGSHVAIVTPFTADGALDLAAFRALVDWHAASGTAGVVVCGTTGEAATLTDAERRTLFEVAVEQAAGRIQVMAGVGTNATAASVENARVAEASGADGVLVVTPYYNRPSPRGLARHFRAVAEATTLPVVLYNVPSRTGTDLPPALAKELARDCENVVAIKEATTSLERIRELAGDEHLALLCGEDSAIVDFMQAGADGAVDVVGNVLPAETAALIEAARPGGDAARAAALREELAPVVRDLFIESNPVPAKAALAWMGRCRADVRLPLAPLEDANLRRLEATLAAHLAPVSAPRRRARPSGGCRSP